MYFDSGADITLIPFTLGKALGFKERADEIKQMSGISGAGVPYAVKKVKMHFNNVMIEAHVAWSLVEGVPPILGRMDVFSKFKIVFDEANEEIRLQPLGVPGGNK